MKKFNRRHFLKSATGVTAGAMVFGFPQSGVPPYIVSSVALGRAGNVAASNRIVMGAIGVGSQGSGNMRSFLGKKEVQMVAVCDVDKSHRDRAKETVDKRYGNNDCMTYSDFR